MTIPGLLLGTIAGGLVGALVHLILGGNLLRLILCLGFGVGGFWLGHLGADFIGLEILSYGPVHVGAGIGVSIVLTVIGYWLTLIQPVKKAE
jgi:hypothetical protein